MGALQYLTFMRLNIYFVVNRVYQFMHSPTYSHWGVIKHILCYLQGMTTYDLHITRSSSSHDIALQMQIGQIVLMIASL